MVQTAMHPALRSASLAYRFSRLAFLICAICATQNSRAEDWPKYMRDLANSAHSAETGISSSNVRSLKQKWGVATTGTVSASPAVATINGTSMVFIGSWNGSFYALNAVTGTQIWSFPIDIIPPCSRNSCRIGSSASVDVANNLVFFGAENAYLYALNAQTGALVWKQQLGDPADGAEVWSSPVFYKGMVLVGLASHTDAPCVMGSISAYNELNGNPVWNFLTIDQGTCPMGVCLGGSVWSSLAIDDVNGIVYAATGNPGASCTPPTANATLYPDAVLALTAESGTLLNYYLAVKNDMQDNDFGSSPILHMSGEINQCTRRNTTAYWVTAMNKLGGIFVLGRNATGLNGTVQAISRQVGFIASPAFLAETTTTQCGPGKKRQDFGNTIFAPDRGGSLLTLSQDHTGVMSVENYNALSKSPLIAAPAVIQDVVLFGGRDGYLYVTKTDGSSLTHFKIGPQIFSGIAISNNRIYFGTASGKIYCFSPHGK